MNLKYQGISFLIRGIAFLTLGVFMAVSEFLLSKTPLQLRWQALLAFPLGVYGIVRLIQGVKCLKAYKKLHVEQNEVQEE
ncbi:MAG: hypothetical protein CMN34_03310 [Saprospirales bacterium]|nr:hypothetical protein [Saprospirales bacterium]|tara:strand:+ start:3286 stop:3525 length:240 start_codon:yes stop_codon:yes gene_type:complete